MMPGRMTMNGNSIFGTAAMSGVRRAAVIESAAIARCTTRKSVHQYAEREHEPEPHHHPEPFDAHRVGVGAADVAPRAHVGIRPPRRQTAPAADVAQPEPD